MFTGIKRQVRRITKTLSRPDNRLILRPLHNIEHPPAGFYAESMAPPNAPHHRHNPFEHTQSNEYRNGPALDGLPPAGFYVATNNTPPPQPPHGIR